MPKIVHTKQSHMVAEHATIRGSGVGGGNENVEKVRVEIVDEFGEKASEQCLGGVGEKESVKMSEKITVSCWSKAGEVRGTITADRQAVKRLLKLGGDVETNSSRVCKSTFAGIQASEHRRRKEAGTNPDVIRERIHPEVQGRQILLRFEERT